MAKLTMKTGNTVDDVVGSTQARDLAKQTNATANNLTRSKGRSPNKPLRAFARVEGPDHILLGERGGEESYIVKRSKYVPVEGETTLSGDPLFKLVRSAGGFIVTDLDCDIRGGELVGSLPNGTKGYLPKKGTPDLKATFWKAQTIEGVNCPAGVYQDGALDMFVKYRGEMSNKPLRALNRLTANLPILVAEVKDASEVLGMATAARKGGKGSDKLVQKYADKHKAAEAALQKCREAIEKAQEKMADALKKDAEKEKDAS